MGFINNLPKTENTIKIINVIIIKNFKNRIKYKSNK